MFNKGLFLLAIFANVVSLLNCGVIFASVKNSNFFSEEEDALLSESKIFDKIPSVMSNIENNYNLIEDNLSNIEGFIDKIVPFVDKNEKKKENNIQLIKFLNALSDGDENVVLKYKTKLFDYLNLDHNKSFLDLGIDHGNKNKLLIENNNKISLIKNFAERLVQEIKIIKYNEFNPAYKHKLDIAKTATRALLSKLKADNSNIKFFTKYGKYIDSKDAIVQIFIDDLSKFIFTDMNYSINGNSHGIGSSFELSKAGKNIFVSETKRYSTNSKNFNLFSSIVAGINENEDFSINSVFSAEYMEIIRWALNFGGVKGGDNYFFLGGGSVNLEYIFPIMEHGHLNPYLNIGLGYNYCFKDKKYSLLKHGKTRVIFNSAEAVSNNMALSLVIRADLAHNDLLNINNKLNLDLEAGFGLKIYYNESIVDIGYKHIFNYNLSPRKHKISIQISI